VSKFRGKATEAQKLQRTKDAIAALSSKGITPTGSNLTRIGISPSYFSAYNTSLKDTKVKVEDTKVVTKVVVATPTVKKVIKKVIKPRPRIVSGQNALPAGADIIQEEAKKKGNVERIRVESRIKRDKAKFGPNRVVPMDVCDDSDVAELQKNVKLGPKMKRDLCVHE
jgi:hypothetical protein